MLKEIASKNAYRLLESGPIVMVTTGADNGIPNVMTLGFHMMMQHDPALVPLLIFEWTGSRVKGGREPGVANP